MTMPRADYFMQCGKAGRPLADCLVIDAHGHIGPASTIAFLDVGAESLVAAMDRLGIDRIYVSSLPAIYGLERRGNDEVIEAVRRFPDRIRGYMILSPGYPETILPEMNRCCQAGLRAVKIWSFGNRAGLAYDHPNYEIIFKFANDRGMPVLAHMSNLEIQKLEGAFRKYDRIKWILAHIGMGGGVAEYLRVAREYGHVYIETCFSSCPRGLVEMLVREAPLEKIIWGSDQLFMNAAQQIGRVLFATITPDQKKAILGANAARVLENNAQR